ncbi:MAG: formylglycine-generating enzyme family protein [Anaerolineae bacterium]|nr:formylglycine-generating enzyme family protein [Anaerolineae bacterium]
MTHNQYHNRQRIDPTNAATMRKTQRQLLVLTSTLILVLLLASTYVPAISQASTSADLRLAATWTLRPIDTLAPTYTSAADAISTVAVTGTPGASDEQTAIQTFDGVEMVTVPAGCFMMGSDNGDENERPVHKQCIEQPFYIDRYEVTNEQFERFGGSAETPNYWNDPKRPREQITWLEANAFCALRGSRLPTEAEWEYAARGPESLIYPWGNTFVADNVVYAGNIEFETADVGSKPGGVSWVGALDMSGNVWEWTNSRFLPYPYVATDGREDNETDNSRVLRGGSWADQDTGVTTSVRYQVITTDLSGNIGFRCARDS